MNSDSRPFIDEHTTCLRKLLSVEKDAVAMLLYLSDEGRKRKVGIGKGVVSKVVCRVCRAISRFLAKIYLKPSRTKEEVKFMAAKFYEQRGFPQCIRAIGGTHVWIKKPSDRPISDLINRKRNYIINCQAVANYSY